MPRRKTHEKGKDTAAVDPRKRTQRERIIAGMVAASNRDGYAGATVSAVIADAGVSRPTFYDYFEDRETCFRATIADVHEELLAKLQLTLADAPAPEAMAAAVRTLLSYAHEQPARARFLFGGSMAGGAAALEARDGGIRELAAAIERAERAADSGAPLPDVETRGLVGAVYRMIATRLRRGEAAMARIGDELSGWLRSYERPSHDLRWRAPRARRAPGRSAHLPSVPIQQMPDVIPPGRVRIPKAEVVENHRLRILYAVARLAAERGYLATTVADITRLASVDGRVFYRHFADKQAAFEAAHELGFQQVMDVVATAYFAGERWPERSWEAGRALAELLQENPLVAHVGFVEAYAVGPGAIQRIEDSHNAFLFFLQEGLIHRPHDSPPSRVAMEAIIASIFELIYLQARRGEDLDVAGMLPQIAHLWLTPFLGCEESDDYIERRMRATPAAKAGAHE